MNPIAGSHLVQVLRRDDVDGVLLQRDREPRLPADHTGRARLARYVRHHTGILVSWSCQSPPRTSGASLSSSGQLTSSPGWNGVLQHSICQPA
ncbi:hypothetical protein OG971_12230 [Streptomyces sp. NBC_00847]|nr:hypothetical protein [Streptomyces sp. NBC_00847]